ncbi:hypothetical protein DCMF_18235 [Candidatus Formimonas warabiya]|uniref:Pro-sigmaK processing inhibitor BofA n=2 Tax=Formimonas warabiya TaxID=1761012 RepID=A0A3G1L249_FORW1|nr:hypothetical protein DCMF_18235 [Candidatus Formimonas warabiya]
MIRFLFKPVKLIVKLLINGATGFILLWLINTFGGTMGIFLPINLVTILVAGILGIPGIFLLFFMKLILAG